MFVVNPETGLEKTACRIGIATVVVVWAAIGLYLTLVHYRLLSLDDAMQGMLALLVCSICVALMLIAEDIGYYCRKRKEKNEANEG